MFAEIQDSANKDLIKYLIKLSVADVQVTAQDLH